MDSIETKALLKKFPEHGLRVLSIRGRYVARAAYLRDHPQFRCEIERRRSDWDAAWPEFAIGTSAIPVDELVFPPGGYSPVPPKLYAANWAMDDVLKGKRPRRHNEDSVAGQTIRGYWAWRQLLTAVCTEWWPARYFPLTHYEEHLAGRFVAGCLLCTPMYLPEGAEEWIGVPTMQPYPLGAPVERMVHPAEIAKLKGWGEALMARLNDAAGSQQVLTPELLTEMWQDAEDAGQATWVACREDLAEPDGRGLYAGRGIHWVLPLFPGVTRDDLEEGASQIMNDLRFKYGDHMLREDARRLSREGVSARAIAGLMGVSPSQAGKWIKGSS